MNKITIDKIFFNLKLEISTGLISGLKILINRNFNIEVDKNDLNKNDCLSQVLKSEGIVIHESTIKKYSKEFLITTKKQKNPNCIVVSKKGKTKNISEAIDYVVNKLRSTKLTRNTTETKITIEIELDGKGIYKIDTGIGFFDHMLAQIAKHSNCNLKIRCKGDLNVDEHHTVEDVGIALGEAILQALGDKKGIKRYGYFLPMDDSVSICCIDLGGRPYLNFNCKFNREYVGNLPTELVIEFFRGLSFGLKANIYIKAKGENEHHKIEAIFKAFAKSLNEACRLDERNNFTLPSTKGIL